MARMDDGFSTTLSFAADPTVLFYEITVTPPGVDGGGEIDTTNMLNTDWRTRWPKSLKTLTEAGLEVAWDAATYDEIIDNLVNVNNLITVTFPDTSTLAFWGWLNTFEPGDQVEGERPTAEIGVIPSNQNDSLVEVAPVYTAPGP